MILGLYQGKKEQTIHFNSLPCRIRIWSFNCVSKTHALFPESLYFLRLPFATHSQHLYVTSKRSDKIKISKSIVDTVKHTGGRFLAQDEKTGIWSDIGEKAAIQKVSQALREGQPGLKKEIEQQKSKGSDVKKEASTSPKPPFAPISQVSIPTSFYGNRGVGHTDISSQHGLPNHSINEFEPVPCDNDDDSNGTIDDWDAVVNTIENNVRQMDCDRIGAIEKNIVEKSPFAKRVQRRRSSFPPRNLTVTSAQAYLNAQDAKANETAATENGSYSRRATTIIKDPINPDSPEGNYVKRQSMVTFVEDSISFSQKNRNDSLLENPMWQRMNTMLNGSLTNSEAGDVEHRISLISQHTNLSMGSGSTRRKSSISLLSIMSGVDLSELEFGSVDDFTFGLRTLEDPDAWSMEDVDMGEVLNCFLPAVQQPPENKPSYGRRNAKSRQSLAVVRNVLLNSDPVIMEEEME